VDQVVVHVFVSEEKTWRSYLHVDESWTKHSKNKVLAVAVTAAGTKTEPDLPGFEDLSASGKLVGCWIADRYLSAPQ